MRTYLLVLSIFALASAIESSKYSEEHSLIHRLIRAANNRKQGPGSDCRYEKEAWEECDVGTGLQRRALKLKSTRAAAAAAGQCEETKYITRPCKKACRYAKGAWTECTNGERRRTDSIKTGSSPNCEASREVVKKCKQVCRYNKSEWSPCEAGIKTKTLTLVVDEQSATSQCEATKSIRKQCGNGNGGGGGQPKQRAKNNKQRARKNNAST